MSVNIPLTIGKLAKQTEVTTTIETIRCYLRLGLLSEPEKPDNGYRDYQCDTVAKIRFIKRAQQNGFMLNRLYGPTELYSDIFIAIKQPVVTGRFWPSADRHSKQHTTV